MKRRLLPLLLVPTLLGVAASTPAVDDLPIPDAPDPQDLFPSSPVFPPPPPTLQAPYWLALLERGVESVRFTWQDRTDLETGNQFQRRLASSPTWTTLSTYGALSGWTTFTATGLSADTSYCFRVRTFNAAVSKNSPEFCVQTRSTVVRPIFRAEVEVTTGDVENAGTDDWVAANLGPVANSTSTGPFYYPIGSRTWLNHSHDDFIRGSTFSYDVDFPADLSDITALALEKEGSNDLCVRRLRLILNRSSQLPEGMVVFDRVFGTARDNNCRWLDAARPRLTIPMSELRAAPSWIEARSNWSCGPTALDCALDIFPLDHSVIRTRIEAMIGDRLHAQAGLLKWAPPPPPAWGQYPLQSGPFQGVELTYVDPFTLHVKIHLKATPSGTPDALIDIDGDLRLIAERTSDGTRIGFEMASIDAHASLGVLPVLGCTLVLPLGLCVGAVELAETAIEAKAEAGFDPISELNEVPQFGNACIVLTSQVEYVTYIPGVVCDDLDSDGMTDAWEVEHGLDPQHNRDATEDPDGDGITNAEEFAAGSDPFCPWNQNDANYDVCTCPLDPGHPNFCRECGPCKAGEGDCEPGQCAAGLVCTPDIGPSYGFPQGYDVCTASTATAAP